MDLGDDEDDDEYGDDDGHCNFQQPTAVGVGLQEDTGGDDDAGDENDDDGDDCDDGNPQSTTDRGRSWHAATMTTITKTWGVCFNNC